MTGNGQTGTAALAATMQKWAELCKQQLGHEPVEAMRWYLKGRADAHSMDAARARQIINPTVTGSPPAGDDLFTQAYEAVLRLTSTMIKVEEESDGGHDSFVDGRPASGDADNGSDRVLVDGQDQGAT